VLVAVVLGGPLLTLLYTPEYAGHQVLLIWLMAAAGLGFVGSFLGYGMTAARYFRVQLPLFAGTALVSAGACVVLIPRFGLLGGALAATAGAGFQVAASTAVVLHAVYRKAG